MNKFHAKMKVDINRDPWFYSYLSKSSNLGFPIKYPMIIFIPWIIIRDLLLNK